MFYARLITNGEETENLYFNNEEFHRDMFNPETVIDFILEFKIYGKTYAERKAWLHDLAVEWSNHGERGHLFMSDLYYIHEWFYKNGKRYGLLKEFRENGLC